MRIIKIILVLSLLLSFGCKTKKVIKNQHKEVEKIEVISKFETIEKESIKQDNKEDKKESIIEDKKEEKTNIKIIGKVDKENPITYYNVVNGDTIDLFKITGNADFIFKKSNTTQNSNINNNRSSSSSNNKETDRTISNAVENVKNTVKEVQDKTVEVVKQDFTIGSYIVFLIWGIVIIALCAFILWLRKSTWWTKIASKF